MNLKDNLDSAEKKAKLRENKTVVDLVSVANEERKANEQGYGLYKLEQKNKATFVQGIKDNLDVLIRNEYLTNAELGFLFSLSPLVEYHSNAVTDQETGQFMTVSDLATYLNRSRESCSRVLSKLIEKGMIHEFVDAQEIKEFNRNVSRRPLFMNPEIIYAGDRNKVDATLSKLITSFERLERKKILLPWKLWIHHNEEHGKLYRRKTYLEFKKKQKAGK